MKNNFRHTNICYIYVYITSLFLHLHAYIKSISISLFKNCFYLILEVVFFIEKSNVAGAIFSIILSYFAREYSVYLLFLYSSSKKAQYSQSQIIVHLVKWVKRCANTLCLFFPNVKGGNVFVRIYSYSKLR